MGFVLGLKCKECGKEYPKEPIHVCDYCFGPLEILYDYDGIRKAVTRKSIQAGPPSIWRYKPLLPIDGEPTVGLDVGMTPLIKAERLGAALGLRNLYLKNDSVCCPTLSFKDRVVAVAVTKAKEFGFDTVSCASTGNLANSVAAHAARAGLKSVIFIPADLETGKILGTLVYGPTVVGVSGVYDDVNRLCSEIASNYPWAFVNINIRSYYGDGSKTFAYEVMEQLGWRTPDHIVVPVAGSSLITKIWKAMKEFKDLGLIGEVTARVHAAQATGCNPVTTAIKNGWDHFKPVRPNTIAKSIAIGNPADGYYGIKTVRESEGTGDDVSDEEIVRSIRLLAETEGVFTETAGGVTVGVTKKLVERGVIRPEELTVICITGNGLKTQEAVQGSVNRPLHIEAKFSAFQEMFAAQLKEA
ncbi:MAG: threonine synthase [Candidatus Tectomicrobia bacterium]|nr:threonine synthase [Candidatus Tectomicrobia bacterium]